MLKQVISALSRFGPESFWPGSIRPWVVSAQFGGSFRPIFSRSLICELIVYEPRCEKTGLRDFRLGPTQTGLYSHRRWLEA